MSDDEANGNGGDDDAGDSNDFRTPADYEALDRLAYDLDEHGMVEEDLGTSLCAFGTGIAALEQKQVAAFWQRWREVRAQADEQLAELEAESFRLTKRPILGPPY